MAGAQSCRCSFKCLTGAIAMTEVLACHGGQPWELPARPLVAMQDAPLLAGSPLRTLGLGADYSCALLGDDSVKCWGSDEYGVLGQDGGRQDIDEPSAIASLDFGEGRRVVRLSTGWHHACVLFEDGAGRCWGRNDRGQLGLGTRDDYGDEPGETLRDLPDLPLARLIDISAGVSNTCAILAPGQDRAGTVHCWGSDTNGGIGDSGSGDFGDDEPLTALRAVALGSERAVRVATGDSVGCAVLESGAVRCWGNNTWGTLGIGATCNVGDERLCDGAAEARTRDVLGLGDAFIPVVRLNQAHACVVDNRGALRCWGRNDQSRAGYPEARFGPTLLQTPGPVELGQGVKVVDVGLGIRHGCALDVTGLVRCWGEAGPQLGYGQTQMDGTAGIGGTLVPAAHYLQMPEAGSVQIAVPADGPVRVSQLAVGGAHACVILERDGNYAGLRCWGHNNHGQLGYGPYSAIGDIGTLATPALEYEQRLGHPDVCLLPSVGGTCAPR